MEVTGLVASASVPLIKHAWMVGRGGAALAAASSVSSIAQKAIAIRGGAVAAATKTKNKAPVKKAPVQNNKKTEKQPLISPRAKAVMLMAIAMAFHYLGYSLARPITISLFTSAKSGYGGKNGAFPFAMAFVSPMSLGLLLGYGKVLDKQGPKGALMWSTFLCAFVMSASAMAIQAFETMGTTILDVPAEKFISGPLFIFRESYVQLLSSQYWSFMASALTPNQSARWFGPIAGLTSITSAVAGFWVSDLIKKLGIFNALLGTGVTLMMSLLAVNGAYHIAENHGFAPTARKVTKPGANRKKASSSDQDVGLYTKARNLFARVPVLKKLFVEILASQGLATILNVVFVAVLERTIEDDGERAGWVGKFFSTINVITMVFQFGILPPLMTFMEPKTLWKIVPLIAMCFTIFQATQEDPTLYIVSGTLLVMKVLEYSARRMLDEMVFVPLDFESRFVGKEVIGVFGYRFGKSIMSLSLSGLTALFGNFGIQEYSIISALVNLGWFKVSWDLSNYVPTRKEAEEAYQQQNKKSFSRPSSSRK